MISNIFKRNHRLLLGINTIPKRNFGAMDEVNRELFEHKFTDSMEFKSGVDKFKCFRILDEEGELINKPYENSISPDILQKMFKTMVMINEADVVYNQA